MMRKKVGLALGGGVVRGMAHLGVLSVLEEAGIPVDYVAGTSAGALVASIYCTGVGVSGLVAYAHRIRWWRLLRPVYPLRGMASFAGLRSFMEKEFGDLQFSDLKIPCVVVATDIERGLPVRLSQGSIAPAVQASCSVPGFISPVRLDGRWLCDGAISDNLPVSVLREMGADYVIGVDVFPFTLRPWLGPLGYFWAAFEVLVERAGGGITAADCLIAPNLSGETYVRFSKRPMLYDLGRQAALKKLDCIRQALDLGI